VAKEIKMPLPSAADLFSTQEERDNESRESVREIPLEEISDFPNHPFKVKMDESMADMAESVKQYGVLVPALVREKPEGGYEMIAGHRRKMASELAEKKEIPCIVRNLTDDEAIIIMVDSNLQREQILPSEKAFAYKMKLAAMNRQGQRTDLTSTPVGQKLGKYSVEVLGESVGESRSQIQRYIRLTELITPILDMVDSGKIAIRPAVELSYLPKEQQTILLDTMQLEDCTPSHAQAIKMRKFADEGRLNEDVILSILSEEKGNQKEQFRMPKERISKYFSPGTPAKQMEDTIVKALELYRKRERSKDRER
jgi:ParB family chromosome partitioning protein